MTGDALLQELLRAALAGADYSPRCRLAVSPEEYEQLRAHLLLTQGRWNGRICNIPLIVEDRDPDLWVEYPARPELK